MKKSKRKIRLFEPLGGGGGGGGDEEEENRNQNENMWSKRYEMVRGYELGKFNSPPRGEVLGAPLTRWEIKDLVKPHLSSNKQVNLGEFFDASRMLFCSSTCFVPIKSSRFIILYLIHMQETRQLVEWDCVFFLVLISLWNDGRSIDELMH